MIVLTASTVTLISAAPRLPFGKFVLSLMKISRRSIYLSRDSRYFVERRRRVRLARRASPLALVAGNAINNLRVSVATVNIARARAHRRTRS